ncbi:hypothetical protein [Polyangium fumosum]|uniref:Uncharacterized protein n=1 Tax=Polyangium fumosum TaxID=889272 RepID=A0A4U1IXY9_9BACT|nr:hypothetical protein [Polyangium fumosum]TKC99499.1 hypothetical protein E8A74_37870 [Polyangium fumosum]
MDETHVVTAGYEVPTYKVPYGATWFHFLHGNVPGHQIDFIYRPEVPQEPLTRQHFSHLSRLVKYIEPRHGSAYAFAIGNLSRDDTQYEPGHGGLALIFGLRIKGAKDHAGRQDPPFCHSAAIVDRNLDGQAIYGTAVQFYQKLLPDEESQAEGSGWYHTYVQHAQNADALFPLLKGYLADFEDLHTPGPSGLSFRWSVENSTPPKRVVIVYPDRVDFPTLAYCMARIANVLVESDVKWTAISNGREQDVVGGLTVRFVPRREATAEPADVVLMYLEQVPEDPAEIAAQLFNAHEVRISQMPDLRMNWRYVQGQQAKQNGTGTGHGAGTATTSNGVGSVRPGPMPMEERARPWAQPAEAPAAAEDPAIKTAGLGGLVQVVEKAAAPGLVLPQPDLAAELKTKQRKQQFSTLIGVGLLVVVLGVIAAVWIGSAPVVPGEEGAGAGSAAPGVGTGKPEGPGVPSAVPSVKMQDAPVILDQPVGTASVKPAATTKSKPRATSTGAATSQPTAKPAVSSGRPRLF